MQRGCKNGNICDHYRLRACLAPPTIPEYQRGFDGDKPAVDLCWINSAAHTGKHTEGPANDGVWVDVDVGADGWIDGGWRCRGTQGLSLGKQREWQRSLLHLIHLLTDQTPIEDTGGVGGLGDLKGKQYTAKSPHSHAPY